MKIRALLNRLAGKVACTGRLALGIGGGRVAHPFAVFLVDILSQRNNTTLECHPRGTGFWIFRSLCPSGWPTLSVLEGRGFDFSFFPWLTISFAISGTAIFISFTCYRRLPLLRSIRARTAFVQILSETRDRYGLKQRVSRRLRRKKRNAAEQFCLPFARGEDTLRRFWQRRFYDFNVWSLKKRVERLHYMYMNPLKRELCNHPREWPWSSFSFYSDLKTGLIRVDPVH